MRKIIIVLIFINFGFNICMYSQTFKYSRIIQGGFNIGIGDKNFYGTGSVANHKSPIGFSYLANLKYSIRLAENVNVILGAGVLRQAIKDKATLEIDSNGVVGYIPSYEYKYENEISGKMVRFEVGMEFTYLNNERWKLSTLASYTPGYLLFVDIAVTGYSTTITPNIRKSSWDSGQSRFSDAIKFGFNGEYKVGRSKSSAIALEISFNQGFRNMGYVSNQIGTPDGKKSNSSFILNKGSFIALQIGYRAYFGQKLDIKKFKKSEQ